MAAHGFDWPSKEELLGMAEGLKSFRQLAGVIGVAPSTLSTYLTNFDLRDEVKAVLDTPTRQPREVDDPDELALQRLRDENAALRKDNREYARRLASEEDLFNRIVEASRVPVETHRYRKRQQSQKKPPNSVVAPIYDQQFGQFVRPTDTPGNRGEFSVEVFDQRLERWVDGVCGIVAKRAEGYRIEELILPMGGDHIEGDEIFAGQSWQLELDPPRQVWELAARMTDALTEVIRFAREEVGIDHVSLYGITGNHGSVGGRKAGARPKTYNWDWLFLKILFDRLRAEPIDQFAIEPGGALFFYCAGHEFQAIHGDQIRGWGGLPFYGLTRHDGRSIRLHNRIHRYLLMGHFHQSAEIPNGAGETIVSGDWVGPNNLSGTITAASRPQQRVLFVSEKWGIDGAERIYFAEADEAYTPTPIYGQGAA